LFSKCDVLPLKEESEVLTSSPSLLCGLSLELDGATGKEYKRFKDGKSCSISAERIATLDGLEFCWDAQEAPRPADPVEPSDKKKHRSWLAMLEKL